MKRALVRLISLSELVIREIRKALGRPARAEVLERIRSRHAVPLRAAPADVVRSDRDSR